jgi:hypothetical protein
MRLILKNHGQRVYRIYWMHRQTEYFQKQSRPDKAMPVSANILHNKGIIEREEIYDSIGSAFYPSKGITLS